MSKINYIREIAGGRPYVFITGGVNEVEHIINQFYHTTSNRSIVGIILTNEPDKVSIYIKPLQNVIWKVRSPAIPMTRQLHGQLSEDWMCLGFRYKKFGFELRKDTKSFDYSKNV